MANSVHPIIKTSRGRLALPQPRVLPWPLRPLDSAETSIGHDLRGRLVLRIRHGVLNGIEPEMLAWWFRNIGGTMQLDGMAMNKYHVWHPNDHIHWALARPGRDGGASVGSVFRIVEAFNRDPNNYVDVYDHVERLDATGFTGVSFFGPFAISRLKHDFYRVSGGTEYVSELTIGIGAPVLSKQLNQQVRKRVFSEDMGRAWLKHNIEEVGLLEHIIPYLLKTGQA